MFSLKQFLSKRFSGAAQHNTQEGITIGASKVVVQTKASTTMHQIQGVLRIEIQYITTQHWRVSIKDVQGSTTQTLLERDFAELDFSQANAFYADLIDQMKRSATSDGQSQGTSALKSLLPWAGGAMVGFVALVLIGLASQKGPVMASASPNAMGSAPALEASAKTDTQASTLPSTLTAAELTKVSQSNKVVTGTAGKKIAYFFTDPFCPTCQRLEENLQALKAEFEITIVPVSFKKGSAELVAQVLCSQDKVSAWKEAIAHGQAKQAACDDGLKQAKANNELFLSLGFSHTPTLVSASGVLAQGDAPSPELKQWILNN